MTNKTIRGIFFTVTGGIAWGFSGACGQYLFKYHNLDSQWLTTIRLLSSGFVLLIVLILRKKFSLKIFKNKKATIRLVIFAIFGLMFCQYTYLTAIRYSNAGTATVLEYLSPVLVLLFVSLRQLKIPHWKEFLAIGFALLGTFLLATHGNFGVLVLSRKALFWGLISAVAYASYTLLPGNLIEQYGNIAVTGFAMLIGGFALSFFGNFWVTPVELAFSGWLAFLAIVFIGTVISFSLFLQGISDLGAVKASMLASVEPLSASIFSALWLKTSFTFFDVIGMVFILTAVLIIAYKK